MMNIVVVGGGAGGLELVTKLGNKLGKNKKANVTLVDRNTSHVWKPLLHELATGAIDEGVDALSYSSHAKNHGFNFQLGTLCDVDTSSKFITLAPLIENSEVILPERKVDYDYLVLAIGSTSNDFNTPGVSENCIFLDSPSQAHKFRRKLFNSFMKIQGDLIESSVDVAIVGAGATGVELSAELYNVLQELKRYGFKDLTQKNLNVNLIEAGDRILPALPPRISSSVHNELSKLGVKVKTNTLIVKADSQGLYTKDGETIRADLMVWAAGIKGPDFLKEFKCFEINRINQIVVKPTLQTTTSDDVYVIGDVAQFTQENGKFVPPRAQSAHQMASTCYKNLMNRLKNKPQLNFIYKDQGSLVSLSRFSTVGNLMGNLTKGSMMIEGRIARIMYVSLYRMHQRALHGTFKTLLMMLVGKINKVLKPSVKLH
ncbi:FAD-dependent oxidoreductase [Paraphotobacterium marinum]|uniref:FAD-dependent oxidoreductase n=1 Tax=Paraphotobacterium marinum TaxID=1755811 RepID=A0A220VEI6_9GAMM|nr:NAD(P)/FAD-dependent oxidoreductase [Paraphotobacterium marinum]ASK78636.1 FAD-dependent oxidoreductase [Paraphotobacterium marinum]